MRPGWDSTYTWITRVKQHLFVPSRLIRVHGCWLVFTLLLVLQWACSMHFETSAPGRPELRSEAPCFNTPIVSFSPPPPPITHFFFLGMAVSAQSILHQSRLTMG